ncbi:FMRFamide-like neuropeptide 11 family protein [Dictyocaulus viviparus]|uniref:FMRFamide-like neuropeptide 11 family protein n=1 Tax=Dictyocaulus viviparus TaxID=29172 RepID=A0A0D8X8L6_DICVI|nr:FMRFamide-like neuropeptide 11 family protein [Dictyocaulus viviparus]
MCPAAIPSLFKGRNHLFSLIMFMLSPVSRTLFLVVLLVASTLAQDIYNSEKRAMRNALVRFGRAGGGMRNALVRFGKRSGNDDYDTSSQSKRNGAPQPFVRFGRSGQVDHIYDILSTLQKLETANYH